MFDQLALPPPGGKTSNCSSLSTAVAVQVDWITADSDEVLAPLTACVEDRAVASLVQRVLHRLQEQQASVDLRHFLAVLKAWASMSEIRQDRLQGERRDFLVNCLYRGLQEYHGRSGKVRFRIELKLFEVENLQQIL